MWFPHQFIGFFFLILVSVGMYFPWCLTFAFDLISTVMGFLFSPTVLYFMPSLMSFLIAVILDSQFVFLNFLRRIRIGLDEHVLYTIAYFPLIWTFVSYFLIHSAYFAFLTSAAWFIFVRFLLIREENLSYEKLCFGLIFTLAYFMICRKVCDSYISSTIDNQFNSSCPPGIMFFSFPKIHQQLYINCCYTFIFRVSVCSNARTHSFL